MSGPLIALDRIVSVEPGKGATGVRNIPQTLTIFDSHFPLRPVLPGVLVLGSAGLLAEILLKEQTGRAWRLAGADRVRYRHFIRPGDQMEIRVDLEELDEHQARLSAVVTVEGRTMTTARALRMVPDGGLT
ncbi:3-hydroxyacyl-ACP dehydratase FabZ family protein [Nonomuraea insulae]|uniref:3-hydroxyacyl-ACP dehydratase FabZ family protein n=1 Tax=Nonomuraea insulae TaxID=1616787 RepID=A0ABW1CNG5_9ACTN